MGRIIHLASNVIALYNVSLTYTRRLQLKIDNHSYDNDRKTIAWQQHAPRDKNGNSDRNFRPYEWFRLPQTKSYIMALKKKLGYIRENPVCEFDDIYMASKSKHIGAWGHYLALLAYLQYLNSTLHVEANLYFLRFKAGDPTLIDEIYRNASVEGKARAELRMKSILKRRSFTDELAAHGCGSDDFGRITNAGYEEAFDKNALQLRQSLGITKKSQPLRDVMPPEMLDQVQLYEGLAAAKMNKDKAQGSYVCETTTRNASRMIREFLEK